MAKSIRLGAGKFDHLAPFSVSSAMSAEFGRRAGKHRAAEVREPRLHLGSARIALISLLSFSTISAGVPFGPPMPNQALAS